ncbi:MAG: hypothetical protein QOG82_1273 [Actinomycetota bacterium]|jgi:hypothetical protein|nr:hypothetical protein [Actinomycetota bacterium]
MDLPPPVQDPERRDDADDPGRRMAAVEAELIALGARLEQLEASLQQAVREETRRASNEIRHTVSELGRRLALDLPQFLDRHRLLIVNELRGGGAAAAAATAPTSAPAPTGAPDPLVAAADDEDDDASSDDPGGGRRKRRRRKEG